MKIGIAVYLPCMFRHLLLTSVLLATFGCTQQSSDISGDSPSQPNIIFILTDDQGYGDLGAHGNPWLKTPHLDKLHDESIRLTNFHVATTCAPTRAGLMSGINCNRAGAWHTIIGKSFLSTEYQTLPKLLQEFGYATGIFGKWHLGDNFPYRPQDRGFNEVLIHGGGGVGQTPDYWENDYFDDTYFHNGEPKEFSGYCTDVWFEESMRWMERQAASEQPFFTYIATNAPHDPFHVGDKYAAPYSDNPEIVSPEFYGMIANIDENIGKLRTWLEESGLDENTLIIFSTDNGTSAGARLDGEGHLVQGYNAGMRGKKVNHHEGGHRVPLFLRFPEQDGFTPIEIPTLTTYTDFMPTLVDYVGGNLELDYAIDGQSWMELLRQGTDVRLGERMVVVDTQREGLPVKGKMSCVMQGDWRLIDGEQLYNLAADPSQREDLAANHPDRVLSMRQGYEAWWASMEEVFQRVNRITVGHEAENPTLLVAHDWFTEQEPPWNQKWIRKGKINNGYWMIDVAETGRYEIRLYRWPPHTGLALNAAAPEVAAPPGGNPQPQGVVLAPGSASVIIAGKTQTVAVDPSDRFVTFRCDLEQGGEALRTQFTLEDQTTLGAYYVEVEKL